MSHHPDWSKRWRVWQDQGDWFVISPEYAERAFRTWREAQDYADRMARTREVVLPRVKHTGVVEIYAEFMGNLVQTRGTFDGNPVYYENQSDNLEGAASLLLTLAERAKHAGT